MREEQEPTESNESIVDDGEHVTGQKKAMHPRLGALKTKKQNTSFCFDQIGDVELEDPQQSNQEYVKKQQEKKKKAGAGVFYGVQRGGMAFNL